MRRGPLALIAAATGAVLLLSAVSCEDGGDDVTLGEVGRADVVEVVDAPATVIATAAVTLTAAAEGTLAELWVGPGDSVSSGDIVAVVDSPAAMQRLEQARDAVAAAERTTTGGAAGVDLFGTQAATDEAALSAFDQAREVAEHISDEELREAMLAQVDAAQAQYEAAAATAREAVRALEQGLASLNDAVGALGTAQRLQATQAYELASATVDALTLRAPMDGVVQLGGPSAGAGAPGLGDLLGGLGEGLLPEAPAGGGQLPGVTPVPREGLPVSAGLPVVTIVDIDSLGLVAEVDETDVLLVEPGIPVEVELDAALGAHYPATVTAVDLLPTPSARGGVAYGVHLSLQPGSWPDGRSAPPPRPGMSAVARLRVGEAVDTLAVPAAAVFRSAEGDVVWTLRDGRATQVPVSLGVQGPELVEVVSGLRPGDQIVVRGADQVTEGQRLP